MDGCPVSSFPVLACSVLSHTVLCMSCTFYFFVLMFVLQGWVVWGGDLVPEWVFSVFFFFFGGEGGIMGFCLGSVFFIKKKKKKKIKGSLKRTKQRSMFYFTTYLHCL